MALSLTFSTFHTPASPPSPSLTDSSSHSFSCSHRFYAFMRNSVSPKPATSSSASSSGTDAEPFVHPFSRAAVSWQKVLKSHYLLLSSSSTKLSCTETEYKFPDPIPEFADAEIAKFKNHLLKRLPTKGVFDKAFGEVEEVVEICTEIFSKFLHTEYGGPGTLLVIPFMDMAYTINERGLPGGPQAARTAVVWAQKHVDKDWEEWVGSDSDG